VAATEPVLLDILNKASDWFKSRGVENHRLDAQLLLGHVLGMKRMDLYMNFDRPLQDTELVRYRELVRRRGAREPLQHLLGQMPFREITLKVDSRALIPRQETELIVDLVRKALLPGQNNTILDVGVGAGPIFLSIQKEIPNCQIHGVDISPACLELTRENAALNSLSVENLWLGDAFSPLPIGLQFDIIVANPPYVGAKELPGLQPEVRDHDPVSALIGGPEGWEFPAELIQAAFSRLQESGTLILEIGIGQANLLKEKSQSQSWATCSISLDYNGVERFLILQK
jgi:release factor glutamine methyltransferase